MVKYGVEQQRDVGFTKAVAVDTSQGVGGIGTTICYVASLACGTLTCCDEVVLLRYGGIR